MSDHESLHRILITGGTGGIGSECVRELASTGAEVSFFYHTNKTVADALARKTGALGLPCDLSDADHVKTAVDQAAKRMSGLDILVCAAGISVIAPVQTVSETDWDRIFDVNLHGVRRAVTSAIPYLLNSRCGRIILIGSMWGKTGASCETGYSASKGALRAFTYALAKELGPSRITVNCIEPGFIDTDMNRHLSEEDRQALIDETPIGRVGTPGDVAAAVRFLASESASFITGQCLGVDGGFAV